MSIATSSSSSGNMHIDGSIINRGVTESDWRRLHARVIPNPMDIETFQSTLRDGKLHEHFLAKDMHKIMQELREILREHGELREADNFPLSGKKADLSRAAAAALLIITRHEQQFQQQQQQQQQLRRRSTSSGPSAGEESAAVSNSNNTTRLLDQALTSSAATAHARDSAGSNSPQLHTPTTVALASSAEANGAGTLAATPMSGSRSRRTPPITDHIRDAIDGSAVSTLPVPTVVSSSSAAAAAGSPPLAPASSSPAKVTGTCESSGPPLSVGGRWVGAQRLSHVIAHNAATPATSTSPHMQPHAMVSSSMLGLLDDAAVPAVRPASVGLANELAVLNESAPPFFTILSVVRRFQLRYGSHPFKFDVPVQYAQAVNSRRLRVYVIPLRHPNHPHRWPGAKEIVVYVNDQCITAPWRRSWPDRKQEVAKSFLPLDITHYLSRTSTTQRAQFDVFNKEYFTPAMIVVVQLFTLDEVVAHVLDRHFGTEIPLRVREQLLHRSSSVAEPAMTQVQKKVADLVALADVAVRAFYTSVTDEDEEDGLEMDDPIISTRCPISQMPMEVPVRGTGCRHLQCIDLKSYLVSCHKGFYWNCALCDRELRPKEVCIDTVLWRFMPDNASTLPSHLRLSVRDEPAGRHHYWHSSRLNDDDMDMVLDSDVEEETNTEAGPSGSGNGGSTTACVDRRVIKKETVSPNTEAESRKRTRSEAFERVIEGSADNPIEL